MKRLLLGLTSIFLVSFQCKAQTNDFENDALSNFNPGYIVTMKNDTIKGFIYDRIDAEMANNIRFKKNSDESTVSKFGTKDLLGFGFDNRRSFNRIQRIKNNKDTTFVFAKWIVNGKIDLWLIRDEKESSEFYLSNNATKKKAYIFRPNNKDYFQIEGSSYTAQDNKYLGILSLVKNEPIGNSKKRRAKFSEKGIQNDIVEYNSKFSKNYPAEVYDEEYVYNYDLTVGIPAFKFEKGSFIRAAFYRNKTKLEKSRSFSKIKGISYHGWFDDENVPQDIRNGSSNYRWQVLSIIPIGYKIQSTSKSFQPYAYAGLGLGILFMTDYKFVDSINTGIQTSIMPFPTINMGAGARVKLGSKYVLAEITPSLNGIFMNIGVSF